MDKNNYRYERKFFITELTKHELESIIKFHPSRFTDIFHKRFVNNIYFDSPGLNNYFDNIQGNLQRIKTRIRWYGKLFGYIDKPKLELKIKNGSLGRKETYELSPFKFDESFNMEKTSDIMRTSDVPEIVAEKLKSLNPVLLNSYTRKYYQSMDQRYRLTIDIDQVFYKIGIHNNSFLYKTTDDINVILELKYNKDYDDGAKYISNHFPFRLTKSSKYVTGIDKLYVN